MSEEARATTPDMSKVGSWEKYAAEVGAEPDLARATQLMERARCYLLRFAWCNAFREAYVGILIEEIFGVFLFRYEPARASVPEWMWVVIGDLPPAYIHCDRDLANPASALDGYMGAMEDWIAAVKEGRSTEGLIPVNAPATLEYAEKLESRLALIDSHVLSAPAYQADLGSQ